MNTNIHELAARFLVETLVEKLSSLLVGEKVPLDMKRVSTGEILIPAYRKINKPLLRNVAAAMLINDFEIDPSPVRNCMLRYLGEWECEYKQAAVGYLACSLIEIKKNKK